ncbi:hypothetical protein V865_000181 [Kwoniella europaea PYCC6329]|uniref:Uncharacterized protein n=1 Tax=Kwoniella europaea PYCC6329 TaxID=1423913 RepID=A0AAX4K8F0_9TREE
MFIVLNPILFLFILSFSSSSSSLALAKSTHTPSPSPTPENLPTKPYDIKCQQGMEAGNDSWTVKGSGTYSIEFKDDHKKERFDVKWDKNSKKADLGWSSARSKLLDYRHFKIPLN